MSEPTERKCHACGSPMTLGRRIVAQEETAPFREKEQQTHWVCTNEKCGVKEVIVGISEYVGAKER